jgi:Ca2+-binding RTX toxin-like protein
MLDEEGRGKTERKEIGGFSRIFLGAELLAGLPLYTNGTPATDSLNGHEGADIMAGGAGNDTVWVGQGNDILKTADDYNWAWRLAA